MYPITLTYLQLSVTSYQVTVSTHLQVAPSSSNQSSGSTRPPHLNLISYYYLGGGILPGSILLHPAGLWVSDLKVFFSRVFYLFWVFYIRSVYGRIFYLLWVFYFGAFYPRLFYGRVFYLLWVFSIATKLVTGR